MTSAPIASMFLAVSMNVSPFERLETLVEKSCVSADSRFAVMGMVPVENLIGRADTILYSNHTCSPEPGLYCASRRSLAPIE